MILCLSPILSRNYICRKGIKQLIFVSEVSQQLKMNITMKTKLFILILLSIGFIMSASATNNIVMGIPITDEELDFQGRDDGDILAPRSMPITFITAVVSHKNESIEATFPYKIGMVTVQIIDAADGSLLYSTQINTTASSSATIDLSTLPTGMYKMTCTLPNGQKSAKFNW